MKKILIMLYVVTLSLSLAGCTTTQSEESQSVEGVISETETNETTETTTNEESVEVADEEMDETENAIEEDMTDTVYNYLTASYDIDISKCILKLTDKSGKEIKQLPLPDDVDGTPIMKGVPSGTNVYVNQFGNIQSAKVPIDYIINPEYVKAECNYEFIFEDKVNLKGFDSFRMTHSDSMYIVLNAKDPKSVVFSPCSVQVNLEKEANLELQMVTNNITENWVYADTSVLAKNTTDLKLAYTDGCLGIQGANLTKVKLTLNDMVEDKDKYMTISSPYNYILITAPDKEELRVYTVKDNDIKNVELLNYYEASDMFIDVTEEVLK